MPAGVYHLSGVDSPVGRLVLGACDGALRLLEFVDPEDEPRRLAALRSQLPSAIESDDPVLEQTRRELAEYFAGTRREFQVPLQAHGTPFQQRVWNVLRTIEYGQTVSYLEESRRLGDEKAIRAVAQANGQNPIAILIPCHRVINAGGQLGGYGGGLLRKQYLLDLERGDRLL